MTSTNDGKDVKSNQTSGPKGKTYYIELYKSLEASLSSDCELRERTQHLCEAWRRIHSLCQHSAPSTHPHLLSWLQRHTARLVLLTEWQSPKSKEEHKSLEEAINDFIKECENRSGGSRDAGPPPWETQLVARGEFFKKILRNPWGHPVLRVLLDPRGEPPSDEEVLEWLKEERGVMFMTRLRQLTASKCDDLALSLSSAVMDRVRACAAPPADAEAEQPDDVKDKTKAEKKPTFEDILKTEAGFTVDVWELLIDMEFVLLHKGDKRSRCIELAKQTPLRNGYQLVERLQSRLETSPREKKLWKNAKEVATLIAQVVITRCMVVPTCAGAPRTALYCCARSLVRALGPRLPDAARALAAPAATARHLHTLAAAVDAQCSQSKEDMKPFVCELYVRAITAGMNELERLKLKTEKEAEARSAEQTLSSWFTQLGLILSASERIRCECTLTAFSVHPTPAMFERIKAAPLLPPLKLDDNEIKEEPNKEFGSWASDSRGQTNFVKTSETLNLKHTQHRANVLSTAIFSEGEALGISPELCTDIAVLLSGPRLKTLSWDTDRELLLENCRTYMERTNFGTRALTTELKYLNLDPREFQHLPEEEDDESDMYYGIEKGYEHHLEEYQEPEEIWQDADDPERTESAHSTDIDLETPEKTKKKQRKTKKIVSSEDDSDPLSLVAEAKRVDKKKERPHSKERSKEPKKSKSKVKPKDPLEIIDQSTEKKKEPKKKRERKKKEKAVPLPKSSLSSLIGIRVANERNKPELHGVVNTPPSLSEVSDYDSQGKSSINSILSDSNETDVLYDGLFSMDELKSPEKSPDKNTLTKNSELHISNGKLGASTSFVRHNASPSRNDAAKHQVLNSPKSRTCSPTSKTVKESLTKLLHYRRQKALETEQRLNLQPNVLHTCSYKPGVDTPTITPAPSPVPVTPISSPQLKVNVPENPKVYINKTQSEQLSELRNEVDNLLSAKTFGIARPVIQYSPKINNNLMNNSQTSGARFQSPSLQKSMLEINKMPQTQVKSTGTEPKATPPRSNASNREKSGDSASQQNFHIFLKELQESINAGAGAHSRSTKKDIKPISRVTPVIPTIKAEPKTSPQCAKQTQKKSSDFLNTFSRLSYLHKNKVDPKGNGTKPFVDALIEYQSKTLQTPPTDAEINRILMEQKIANANFIQTTNETVKSPSSKSNKSAYQQPENSQSLLKKFNKPVSNTIKHASYVKQNPIIANILNSHLKKPVQPENVYKNVQAERQREMSAVSSKVSSLTERDQQDLLALLRQQTKLNHRPKVENLKEKVQPPHTITGHMPSTNYSVPCTSQSSSKHKILDAPNIINTNVNNKQMILSPSIKSLNNNLDLRMPQTKPLNMVKTELNCTKTVDQKPAKKIEILSNIEIKSSVKHESETEDEPIEETDWEKVMDEILSHKTPSRGPTALDMALNKDACNKKQQKKPAGSLKNQRIVKANSTEDFTKMTYVISKSQPKPALTADAIKSAHPPVLSRSNTESVIKINKKSSKKPAKVVQTPNISLLPANSKVTSSIQPETPKRQIQTEKRPSHAIKDQKDVLKKLPLKPHEKQFTARYFKEEDPFISGIPNSDYDLLEELMDDDLRQEIGELSSDEDNYRVPIQDLKDKNYIINKHTSAIQEEKRLVAKNELARKKSVSKGRTDISKTAYDSSVQKQHTPTFSNAVGKTVIKTAEYVRNEAKNVQPTIAIHQMPQTVKTPLKTRSNECYQANTGQARTVDQIHTFMTNVPQQTALRNVVLIGSDIVYQPCTVQTPVIATNVVQNTYVTYNSRQNMALYQTTQFAAPVVNPLIIGNAMTVSKTTLATVSSKQEIRNDDVQHKTVIHDTKDIKSESKTNPVDDLNDDTSPKSEKEKIDINYNKNICERKVLSEVQEKQKITTEKIEPKNTRSQARKSFERDLMNEVIKDQERLQKKRLSILNRNICHRSDKKAIPLSYAPLKALKIILKIPKVPQRKHEHASGARNGIKNQSRTSKTTEDSVEAKVINPDKTNSTENYKENKDEAPSSRRILLRSSNKDVKLDTEAIEKVSVPRKTKVKLKPADTETANKTLEKMTDSLHKLKVIKKPVTKKIRNKKIKKLEVKKKATKIQPKRNAKVIKTTTDGKPEPKPQEVVIQNEMTDLMDIEDEIITSKILEVMSPDLPILPLQEIPNVEEILGDIEENRTDVSTNDNCLSPSILDNDDTLNQLLENTNIDNLNNDATVYTQENVNKSNDVVLNKKDDVTPEIIKTVHKPVAEDTNENNTAKQNETNTDIVDEIESYVKKLEDNLKDTANNQRLDLECNEIMFSSSEVSKSSSTQPEGKTTEVITPVDSAKQNTIEPKINNNKAKSQEKSIYIDEDIICIDEDDEEPNNDKNNEPLKQNIILPIEEGKTNRQEKRKHRPKDEIPQSYMDAIILEDLPYLHRGDPMKKIVRIKLPCGKVFKATIHGRRNVDTKLLFSDPALKRHIMSNLSQNKRYTLNITNAIGPSNFTPEKIESRIQESRLVNPLETINLVSDSDEDTQSQTANSFKTEFGKYQVQTMEKKLLEKHQIFFDKKCVVKLKKIEDGPKYYIKQYISQEEVAFETSDENYLTNEGIPAISLQKDKPAKTTEEPATEFTVQPIIDSVVEPLSDALPITQHDQTVIQSTVQPETLLDALPITLPDGNTDIQTKVEPMIQSAFQAIQAIIESDKQPASQPVGQPIARSDRLSITQLDEQPKIQPDALIDDQPINQPGKQPEEKPVIESVIQSDSQPVLQPEVQPEIQSDRQPIIQPVILSVVQPVIETDVQPVTPPDVQPKLESDVQPAREPDAQPATRSDVQPIPQLGVQPMIEFDDLYVIQSNGQAVTKADEPKILPVVKTVVEEVAVPVAQADVQQIIEPVDQIACESMLTKPTQQKIVDIIEIDDSSSDGADVIDDGKSDEENTIIGLMEQLDEPTIFKDMTAELFKPAQRTSPILVDAKINEFKNLLFKDLGIEDLAESSTQSNDSFLFFAGGTRVTDIGNSVSNDCVTQIPTFPDCVVKLTRCDELVRKYEDLKLLKKCFIELVRCDELVRSYAEAAEQADDIIGIDIPDNVLEETAMDVVPLSRSGSFSILDNCDLIDVLQPNDQIERNNSPVMEAYDTIASLCRRKAPVAKVASYERLACETEGLLTKAKIHLQDSPIQDHRSMGSCNAANICDNVIPNRNNAMPLKSLVLRLLNKPEIHLQRMDSHIQDNRSIERCNAENSRDILKPNRNNVMPLKSLVLQLFHDHSLIDQINAARLKTKRHIRNFKPNRKRKSLETDVTNHSKIAKTGDNSSQKNNKDTNKHFETEEISFKATELVEITNEDCVIAHDNAIEESQDFSSASCDNSILEVDSRTSYLDPSEDEISASVLRQAHLMQTEFYIDNNKPQFLTDAVPKATELDTENLEEEDTISEVENICMDADEKHVFKDTDSISEIGILDAEDILTKSNEENCINTDITPDLTRDTKNINEADETSPEIVNITEDVSSQEVPQSDPEYMPIEDSENIGEDNDTILKESDVALEKSSQDIPTEATEMVMGVTCGNAETELKEIYTNVMKMCDEAETKHDDTEFVMEDICDDVDKAQVKPEMLNIFKDVSSKLVDTELEPDNNLIEPETKLADSEMLAEVIYENTGGISVMTETVTEVESKLYDPDMPKENVCDDSEMITTEIKQEANTNLVGLAIVKQYLCDNHVTSKEKSEMSKKNVCETEIDTTEKENDSSLEQPGIIKELIFKENNTVVDTGTEKVDVMIHEPEMDMESIYGNTDRHLTESEMSSENVCQEIEIETTVMDEEKKELLIDQDICYNCDNTMADSEMTTGYICRDTDEDTEIEKESETKPYETEVVLEDIQLKESEIPTENVCVDADTNMETIEIVVEADTNLKEQEIVSSKNTDTTMVEPELTKENISKETDAVLADSEIEKESETTLDEPEAVIEGIQTTESEVPTETFCDVADKHVETTDRVDETNANLEEQEIVSTSDADTTTAEPEMTIENICVDMEAAVGDIEIENESETTRDEQEVVMRNIQPTESEIAIDNVCYVADTNMETSDKLDEANTNLEGQEIISTSDADTTTTESEMTIENICGGTKGAVVDTEIRKESETTRDEQEVVMEDTQVTDSETPTKNACDDTDTNMRPTEIVDEAYKNLEDQEIFSSVNADTTTADPEMTTDNICEETDAVLTDSETEKESETALDEPEVVIEDTQLTESEIPTDKVCNVAYTSIETTEIVDEANTNIEEQEFVSTSNADTTTVEPAITTEIIYEDSDTLLVDTEKESETIIKEPVVIMESTQLTESAMPMENVWADADINMEPTEIVDQEIVSTRDADTTTADPEMTIENIYEEADAVLVDSEIEIESETTLDETEVVISSTQLTESERPTEDVCDVADINMETPDKVNDDVKEDSNLSEPEIVMEVFCTYADEKLETNTKLNQPKIVMEDVCDNAIATPEDICAPKLVETFIEIGTSQDEPEIVVEVVCQYADEKLVLPVMGKDANSKHKELETINPGIYKATNAELEVLEMGLRNTDKDITTKHNKSEEEEIETYTQMEGSEIVIEDSSNDCNTILEELEIASKISEDTNSMKATEREKADETKLKERGLEKETDVLVAHEKEKPLKNICEDVQTESQESRTDHMEHYYDALDRKFEEIETKLKCMFEDTDSMPEEIEIAIENDTKEHDAIANETYIEHNICEKVNETKLETVNCKENNYFYVDKINDKYLVEEIVDMRCDEILDDETARTVFKSALIQVNESSTHEPTSHINEELRQMETQEMILIDNQDTRIRTFKDNVLLGAHSSSLLIDCDDEKSPEENILITQQIGEDGRIEEIDIKLNFPRITYSKKYPSGLIFDCLFSDGKNRKRKIDMKDVKINTKRYRKGKNIDFPKITVTAMGESAYAKEFKQLMDYCSSVKFSYSRPFHKEYIDVQEILQSWPIKGICNVEQLETENDETLFTDTENGVNTIHDPSIQTLAEEIGSNNEPDYESSDIIETNFNMGFGERSGRVIQNLEDVCGTKFSAATLSDVKQTQPLLLSENYGNYKRVHTINFTKKYEIEKLQSNIRCIQVKDKVRSFFKKTMDDLSYELIKQQEKDDMCSNGLFDSSDFPFGLTDPDFIQPAPFEAIVQVVQVGQLPVSAAAQNPVTCDPRVTQVSNVSPSQCAAENSPGDDQSVIKTEYTELTTADLSIPLAQEYVQHIQSMPMPPHGHEVMNYPMGSNYSDDVDIKPDIKIEMEETPEIKEEINDNYENSEYPPLFEKNMMNSVDYSHITPLEPNSNVTMIYNYTDKHSVPEAYPHLKQQEHLQMQQQLDQQQQHQEQYQHEQEQYQHQQEQYHQQQHEQYQQQQKIMQQQLEQEQQQLQHQQEQQLQQQQEQQLQQQQEQQLQQQQEQQLQLQQEQQLQQQQEQQLQQQQDQQLQQQQEYQQRQIELQQIQLEQEKQKRLELQQLKITQQQQEQKQQRLQELKQQQELRQQQEQEEEIRKHQQRLLELKRAQDLKQQQQQLQQELRQQKQHELKQQQQKQKELKQKQQLELKQQKQQELKQKQQKQQLLKQQQQKQQELKQQQLAQLKQQKQQQQELKQQQLKQQKQQQLQQKQQMQQQQELQQKQQLQQQQELQQKQQFQQQQQELQQKQQAQQQAQQQRDLQQKQEMQQQQELQQKQQLQQQHELQQKQQIQQQQQELQQQQQQNGTPDKTDQIAHAMNAAGISSDTEDRTQALVNMISQKLRQGNINTGQSSNNFQKTTTINAMALQQALAQILPPPLNQPNSSENNQPSTNTHTPQVLHIVQGKSASGNHQQITLVDNTQQSVINAPSSTPVLHIVQNKTVPPGPASNGTHQQTNSFSGLSLVDGGLQQGNQLLHIVNAGNQKNANTGQLLKRVNLLTNLTNAQGGNEQKMVQFVCKSADGKSIQLNGPHQRSMVLRLQPVETPNLQPTQPKQIDAQEMSPTDSANSKDAEIKSRSIYEENYAKFIQSASPKTPGSEKGTSLPKFNQAFGKQMYQDGGQKNEISNGNAMSPTDENPECQANDNAMNLDHISQIGSPPLLMRKPSTTQAQPNLVQQIKQTISPMNLHGGVIYTRQIPVNLGGGQTINLITVPSSELGDEANQKQQGEIEPSIIKIVPQTQTHSNTDGSEESNTHMVTSNDNAHTPQPQQVLTQMRIKLPMLSKAPQMVSGGRVVRPSFFQIQRNVISGANQPVYQQLVLTAAPQLGQQTIRLPQAQAPQTSTSTSSRPAAVKATPSESQSSTESMSSSTLEQLREFDLVLEQVKERSTVQPPKSKSKKKKEKAAEAAASTSAAASEPSRSTPAPHKQHQVLYSIGNTQPLNVAYVNRKGAATPAPASTSTPTTSTFVRSPDSSGIVDSPTSSSQIPHTVTSEPSTSSEAPAQSKKSSSKSKSRPKASSNPPSTLKLNTTPPKPSTQKPAEDEQTTQRILYILAEYKEQVENSPDKDKPAPRRRTNPPSNPGSSKRKKHRRNRDLSPTDDSCRTMGSEDSSCGTSQGDCNESCIDSHSPQDSPRKVVRKLTFEHDTSAQSAPPTPQPRPQPQQRNVIVADGQTITVARGTAGKPSTAVLMPANYILPVSMIKGGQQIAIVTNRGPKLLTVGGGEGGTTNALLLQRLIGPAGLKPVLTRPGVRHVRLPTAALHNLQAFNLATATTIQPPDSTASPAPAPTPPELIETRANSSPWRTESREEMKPERGSSPEGEPWHLPATANPHDYSYEEVVRTDMERTVLVVQKKDGSHHRQHRLTHVSAAALRHKYAILEHELRLQEYLSQKSLSEECEDLGVDSPSASELFPEAELLFAASPAHDHTQDHGHHSHTPQPLLHHGIPQPDLDDQIATDQLLQRSDMHDDRDLGIGLEDVGIVTVSEDGMQATIQLDQEEFARSHPNTTFHSEPTDEGEISQPFTISGLKGRHITSTIFHANRAPGTVLMTAPQTTVISQATAENSGVHNTVKYADIDNMINSLPGPHTHNNNINLSSVLVKDDGLTRFDSILNDNRELHLSNSASHIVHATSNNTTQVIRRVCYGNKREQASRFLMDESENIMASHHAKMMEDSRDFGDVDEDGSSPERAELFWESSQSERETRRPLDFSSDSDKCCKSPSFEENNSTDSSGLGAHMRLDSVIKDARGIERRGSADGSSADDAHAPPLRTYPPKRAHHALAPRSVSGKTRAPGPPRPPHDEGRRRASGRGVVKRGCHCCSGEPAPPRPKKPRQRKPNIDFTTN